MNIRLMIERTKANKAGDCTVYVEVSVTKQGEKKKIVRIPTIIKVKKDSWNSKSQSVIRNKAKDYYKINQMLNQQKDIVIDIIAKLSQEGRFQLDEIKQKYFDRTSPIIFSFFEVYNNFLEIKEQTLTRNGIKDYKTLKTHLLGFEKFRKKTIIISEIDNNFFEQFEIYLFKVKLKYKDKITGESKSKSLADSTIIKNLRTLRVFMNQQIDKNLPINLSYKKFKIKKKPETDLITLETDEFILLLKKNKNERLEKVRKLFVLQCSTGLRYSDVIKIRKNHIRNGVIYLNSTKTRQKLTIPLNEISENILIECNYDTSNISISNQKYNDYIKELSKEVGIIQPLIKIIYRGNKEVEEPKLKYEILGSHDGRRFFITQNLINGIRPEVIMSMTGHVDFRSFKKYIAITDKHRFDAMDKWSDVFGNSETKTKK